MLIDTLYNIGDTVYVGDIKSTIYSIQAYRTHIEYELWDGNEKYIWYKEYQISKEKTSIGFMGF